jgi:hypothetical protein
MKLAIIASTIVLLAACFIHFSNPAKNPPEQPERKTRTHREISHALDPLPPPLEPITPTKLGIRPKENITDHAAHLRELITAGDASAIQSATFLWFQQNPEAARQWIISQPDHTTLEPAISYIANHIGDTSSVSDALDFAEIIPSEDLRNQTYHQILALALRNGKITLKDLDLTGLPQSIIEDLSSGAPLD